MIAGYKKLPIKQTPKGHTPSGAADTVRTFAKPHVIRRYNDPVRFSHEITGSDYEELDIKGVVYKSEFKVEKKPDGEVSEGKLIFYYISEEGSEEVYTSPENNGIADIFVYRGNQWKADEKQVIDADSQSSGLENFDVVKITFTLLVLNEETHAQLKKIETEPLYFG